MKTPFLITRVALRLAQVMLAVGIVLQVALRDRLVGVALVFYLLPLPVLALVALVAAGLSHRLGRRTTWVCWLLCLALSGTWFARSWCWGPATSPPAAEQGDELRVLAWNMARPDAPSARLVELIRELHPHLAVLNEPGRAAEAAKHLPAYEATLPGYKAYWMGRGITWLSRLPSRNRRQGKLAGAGAYLVREVDWMGQKLPVVALDVYALPFRSRGGQLQAGLDLTGDDPRALLMGDLNTPAESVYFRPVRERMRSAFEVAGRGFRETWPWGIPVLTLDYIWVGRNWEVLEARRIHTSVSDHAVLFARLHLRGTGPSLAGPPRAHNSG